MNTEQKKQRERWLFDRARDAVPAWTSGEVDSRSENPDIVVSSNGLLYGVEVTELIHPARRADIQTKRIICELARRKACRDDDSLRVSVCFSEAHSFGKLDQQPAADELAALVSAAIARFDGDSVTLELHGGFDFSSARFSTIYLHRTPESRFGEWRPVQAWWVPPLTADDVQGEIDRKSPRLRDYQRRAPSIWLLLVTDGFDGSTARCVAHDVYQRSYKSPFSGVVLFEDAMNRATLLCG